MDVLMLIKNKKWVKFVSRGEFSFLEVYVAALGLARMAAELSLRMDGVFIGENGTVELYEPEGSSDRLKNRLQNKDVIEITNKFRILDKKFNNFLDTNPFDNFKNFFSMYETGYAGEFLGYRIGLYSKEKKALKISEQLRGIDNAQHRVLTKFLPKLFKLISDKYKLKEGLVSLLLPKEIISGIFKLEVIKKRSGLYAVTVIDGKVDLFTGKEAIKLIKPILESEKQKNSYDETVSGTVAYRGKVIGMVRIVNNKNDMGKLKKGDVLVSIMTRTDLVPAMKKASAIITDEGGITCHAAIISRELKKPCITGTKNATKILKNGDLISVDANKGIINIIKKSK